MPSEMDRRQEMQRTMTLSEQLSKPDPAIRDFLKIPHDDGDAERRSSTLMAAISRDGPTAADSAGGGMINWKPLRDRLRLLRAASAWAPSPSTKPAAVNSTGTLSDSKSGSHRSNKYNYSPGEAAAAFSRTFSRAPSLRATPTFSRASSTRVGHTSESTSTRRAVADDEEEEEEEEDDDEDDNEEEGEDEAPAAQMSLLALLEQTDSQWDDDDEEEDGAGAGAHGAPKNAAGDEDEDDGEGREEEMVHVCCVCMVRHKGAAFIPCGHTFCRLCSRELWVSRGNCPLCNGFIQEILDIF